MLARHPGAHPLGAPGLLVAFKSASGRRLTGRLLPAAGTRPAPCLVVVGDGAAWARDPVVAETLQRAGLAVFHFDCDPAGPGEPEAVPAADAPGRPSAEARGPGAEDLGAALDLLVTLDEIDARRLGALGVGPGAAVAIRRAADDPRIRALALCAAAPAAAEDAAPRVRVPVLLLVGERTGPSRLAAEALGSRLGGPARLAIVPADPRESPVGRRLAATRVAEWFREHLARPE